MRALAFAIAGAFLCAIPANAGSYVEATGGGAVFQDVTTEGYGATDFDNASWGAAIAAGHCWASFCIEGEALHLTANVDEGSPLSEELTHATLGFYGVAGNAVFEIPVGSAITSYVFGGAGASYAEVSLEYTGREVEGQEPGLAGTEDDAVGGVCFLSQGGAGVRMALSDGWQVFSEARYVRNDFCKVHGVEDAPGTEVIFAGAGLRRTF